MAGNARFRIWAAIAGLEAATRLFLQVVTTAVLARILPADDFGITALITTLVTIFTVCVGMPFEEAIAQRKVLRSAHVGAALSASYLVGMTCFILSLGLGMLLGWVYHQSQMQVLLPVATLLVFPNAALIVATAMARRYRQFNAVAIASFTGNVVGGGVAIVMGLMGAGIWSLVCYRLITTIASAIVLVSVMRLRIWPRWSLPHLRDLSRFAWYAFGDRLTENMTYMVFNYAAGSMFGLTVLGHFNMAMRVIEPIRGAVIAIGHNLNFSHLQSSVGKPSQMAARVQEACVRLTRLTSPAFFGIAAVAGVLIPTLAGPGWEESIPMTGVLAVGSAMVTATQPIMTGLSVSGHPEYSFYRSVFRLFAISLGLAVFAGLGAIGVGFARVLGDVSDLILGIAMAQWTLPLTWGSLSKAIAVPAGVASIMALLTNFAAQELVLVVHPILALSLSVALGIGLYAGLMALLLPVDFRQMLRETVHARA